jgi:hypothetical protein
MLTGMGGSYIVNATVFQGDLGEYNQCQTQLRELYRLGIPGREYEFIAYRILYLQYAQNHSGKRVEYYSWCSRSMF